MTDFFSVWIGLSIFAAIGIFVAAYFDGKDLKR